LSESSLFRNTYEYLNREDTPLVTIMVRTTGGSEHSYDPAFNISTIHWNRNQTVETYNGKMSSALALAHEMEHARINFIGGIDAERIEIGGKKINLIEENYIIRWFERPIARERDEAYRNYYFEGTNYDSGKACKVKRD
jgi:hypothetical protein